MNINRVILSGRITNEPVARRLNTGNNVLTFNLETIQEFKGQTGTKRVVNFIDCVVWGAMAEHFTELIYKDSQVLVEGQLGLDSFVAKSGEKKTKQKVNVQLIELNQASSSKSSPEEDELEVDNSSDRLPF